MRARAAAAIFVALAARPGWGAETRLVLLGGGRAPETALARFVQWAGGARARILVVPWGADDARDGFEAVRAGLRPFAPGVVEAAPSAPLRDDARAELRRRLERATGIFLAGGDQQRLLDALADDVVAGALRARYRDGVPLATSSAGTAVVSTLAITGEGDFAVIDAREVGVRAGLGLLPGVILDQHFIRRQRENRLFSLVLAHPRLLGVGIDEGAALLVRAGRHAEAAGGQVMAVDGSHRAELRVSVLNPGETFDLEKRKRGRAADRANR
ncbi:MAG TPA: cyanophycinase [Vicinamibacteria bacterium]|jgi:cyanophycinase